MNYLLYFLLAFFFSTLGTKLAIYFASRLKIYDHPGKHKIHLKPIPLLGGLGIYIVFSLIITSSFASIRGLVGIFFGGLIVIILGIIDDTRGMEASSKVFGTMLAAIFAIYCGVKLNLFVNEDINITLSLIWIVVVTQAFNLIDGLDGLAAGIGAISAFCFFVFGLLIGDQFTTIFAIVLSGCCLGFLTQNFHPAKIFLGDSGSMYLGFLISVLGLRIVSNGSDLLFFQNLSKYNLSFFYFLLPVFVLGIPLFDGTFTFSLRILNRIKITQGGQDHIHHRLLKSGLSTRKTVLICYLLSIILGLVALLISVSNVIFSILGIIFVIVLAARFTFELLSIKNSYAPK